MAYAWSCITTSSASQQRRPPTSTRGKRSLWDVRTQRISHDIFLRNVSGEKCGTPAKVSSGEAMIPAARLRDWSSEMIVCLCGEVFTASGSPKTVKRKRDAWTAKHATCASKKREGRKVFWLSFCDAERPAGQQFLGACLVEVTAAEADEAADHIALMFPFAQPDAEWIGAALKKTHQLGCNPGGQVASVEIPTDHPNLSKYQFGVLMDRATIEHLDQLLAPGDPEGR